MSWTDGSDIRISGYNVSQEEWDLIFKAKTVTPVHDITVDDCAKLTESDHENHRSQGENPCIN